MSTSTPWGIADYIQPCVRGVALVQTPSHGGIRVSKGLAERELSSSCRAAGEQMYGYYFFEEDCTCALPFFEHPEWFKNIYHDNETVDIFKDKAKTIIERWFPEYFTCRAKELALKESLMSLRGCVLDNNATF